MNTTISANILTIPPGFVFRGQAGLIPNEFFPFGGTQTLVPINPGNNIPLYREPNNLACMMKCNKQLPINKRQCRNKCSQK
jgi:hypothetical protein